MATNAALSEETPSLRSVQFDRKLSLGLTLERDSLVVASVLPDTQACKLGVTAGSILMEVNGHACKTVADYLKHRRIDSVLKQVDQLTITLYGVMQHGINKESGAVVMRKAAEKKSERPPKKARKIQKITMPTKKEKGSGLCFVPQRAGSKIWGKSRLSC